MYNLYLGNEYWYSVYTEDEHEAMALFSSFPSLSNSLGKEVTAEVVDVDKIISENNND
jgi:hypothetical protein